MDGMENLSERDSIDATRREPSKQHEPSQQHDERLSHVGMVARLLRRPEVGALVGALAVFLTFTLFTALDVVRNQDGNIVNITVGIPAFLAGEVTQDIDGQEVQKIKLTGVARWLDAAAPLGIMAIAVSLLMIGGEFDLSSGIMTGTTGLLMGLVVTQLNINVWLGILISLLFALSIGFMNGFLVLKTRLPSFIVTLSTFFILRGANLGITKLATGTVRVEGIRDAAGFASAEALFAVSFGRPPADFRITIVWWIVFAILATIILQRTRIGNWIFSVGGDALAARNSGVPVTKTKIGLFMTTSAAAWFVGISTALRFGSVQAGQGVGSEFLYIIAAVVGGCLLTGGFGSAIGGSIGALIMGMAFIGIAFAGWNTDWRWLFVGVLLLAAVLINNFIRTHAMKARSKVR